VASATFAITVLGFDTVRAIAAVAASGVTGDLGTLPEGFWSHSASVAIACSLVAPRVSVRGPEAFSLGLMHDLGAALLHRGLGPIPDDAPPENTDTVRIEYERERWGIDHATAASRVLGAWWFPEEFTRALGMHHDGPTGARSNLERALVGGEALARCASGVDPALVAPTLALVNLQPADIRLLTEKVRDEAEGLASSLASI